MIRLLDAPGRPFRPGAYKQTCPNMGRGQNVSLKDFCHILTLLLPRVSMLHNGTSVYCKTLIFRVTLYFARPPLRIYIRDFILAICHILFYNSFTRYYRQGLYIHVSMLSRIYAKIKSSPIKSVLQYIRSLILFCQMYPGPCGRKFPDAEEILREKRRHRGRGGKNGKS